MQTKEIASFSDVLMYTMHYYGKAILTFPQINFICKNAASKLPVYSDLFKPGNYLSTNKLCNDIQSAIIDLESLGFISVDRRGKNIIQIMRTHSGFEMCNSTTWTHVERTRQTPKCQK